jgi:hypothetical protein
MTGHGVALLCVGATSMISWTNAETNTLTALHSQVRTYLQLDVICFQCWTREYTRGLHRQFLHIHSVCWRIRYLLETGDWRLKCIHLSHLNNVSNLHSVPQYLHFPHSLLLISYLCFSWSLFLQTRDRTSALDSTMTITSTSAITSTQQQVTHTHSSLFTYTIAYYSVSHCSIHHTSSRHNESFYTTLYHSISHQSHHTILMLTAPFYAIVLLITIYCTLLLLIPSA